MVVFFKKDVRIFRALAFEKEIVWLIDFNESQAGLFSVTYEELGEMRPCPIPEGIFNEIAVSKGRQSACDKRVKIIEPLIADECNITDKHLRTDTVKEIMAQHGVSRQVIYKWYYTYLAGGKNALYPPVRKKKESLLTEEQKNFKWAINKYYYSSKKMSLKQAYEMMLLAKYSELNGTLTEGYPSMNQFQYFFYKAMHNPVRHVISREGMSHYQRNVRPLYGKAYNAQSNIGVYEMDATLADIYLVSQYDRKEIIGRPTIILAVDVASSLVAGVYVGMDGGEDAVMKCLLCAATNKVEFCAKYGIGIQPGDWPAQGIPGTVITDRGKEFVGKRMQEFGMQFDVTCVELPPYRPDLKGTVEKKLDLIQSKYKHLLKGKGVIEFSTQERGMPDYRLEATLTLYEFTKVVINCILYYNAGHIQNNFLRDIRMVGDSIEPTAAALWEWYKAKGQSQIKPVSNTGELYVLWPRSRKAYFSRKGLLFETQTYFHSDYNERCARAGLQGKDYVEVAYNHDFPGCIYLIEGGQYTLFNLADEQDWRSWQSKQSIKNALKWKVEKETEYRSQNVELSNKCNANIVGIVSGAAAQTPKNKSKSRLERISNNKKWEKGMRYEGDI